MKKDVKTFTGYFNYHKLKDGKNPATKSYNFKGKTKAEVDALRIQYQGPEYHFIGEVITDDPHNVDLDDEESDFEEEVEETEEEEI